MFTVFLGLGSNLGDRLGNIEEAIRLISEEIGSVDGKSKIYQTAAWGITDQEDFYNQVVRVNTALYPLMLMDTVLNIERKMGRVRKNKWTERTIDIDVLFFEKIIISTPNLIIPHPFLHSRMFVLRPLVDLEPGYVHPVFNVSLDYLSKITTDDSAVTAL